MPVNRLVTADLHRQLSFVFLSATILVLPVWEFPKLLFLLLFIVSVIVSTFIAKTRWRPDAIDYLLLAWILSGFVIANFSPFNHKEWQGATSNVFIPLTLLCLKQTRFSTQKIHLLLIFSLISTLIATVGGFWQIIAHGATLLRLHSVGHVNHSAIYLCLNFAVALALCLTNRQSPLKLSAFILCLLFITFSIVYSASRGSAVTMLIIAISTSFFWLRKSKKPFIISLISLTLVIGAACYWKAPIIEKTLTQTSSGGLLPVRKKIWNSALLIWRHNPVFGIGLKNYGQADEAVQSRWLADEGRQFSSDIYQAYNHAHNFYLNVLAEQGLFGFGIILSCLLLIALSLLRNTPKPGFAETYWILWLSALGGLQVVLINGLVNTTLHHEHGLLFAILAGLWLSYLKFGHKPSQ